MKISDIGKLAEILSRGQRAGVGAAARPKYLGRKEHRSAYNGNNSKSRKPVNYSSPNKVGP